MEMFYCYIEGIKKLKMLGGVGGLLLSYQHTILQGLYIMVSNRLNAKHIQQSIF
jgi:hypothetical protein